MSDIEKRQPRAPVQDRSQVRLAKVIEEAERMLEAVGPEKTTIPEVAKAAGLTRASIYQYFPDKYALFGRIAEDHLAAIAAAMAEARTGARTRTWTTLVRLLIETAADYYDSHPAAGILLLQGAFSHASHAAHTAKNVRLGDDVRRALAAMRPPLILPESPDAATLAVEIAFACVAHGYAREGRISPGARSEALRAASSYLATWA